MLIMNLLFWALTIGVIGKVLLGVGVLIAHNELAHERKIDQLVLKSFRIEHSLTIAGLVLIVLGYALEVYFYDFIDLINCVGPQCSLSAAALLAQ
jgi:hypothetical protein